jgi:hypothetical protein
MTAGKGVVPGTALPWKQGTGGGQGATNGIYQTDADGNSLEIVASTYAEYGTRDYAEREANARYIVHACNSYPHLVKALEEARGYIMSEAEARNFDPPVPLKLVADMEAALTLASGDALDDGRGEPQ